MKLLVIGVGQCGNKIADEFARLNIRARRQRGIEILTGAFAVNTDTADLRALSTIKSDYRHRILIGSEKTKGHGVANLSYVAAEIAMNDSDKIINAVKSAKRLTDTDAFLVAAGTAGGTGAGVMPIIIQSLKARYQDLPVYSLAVLPFEHEDKGGERIIYNTATCLKSVSKLADAVFLVDNQRYVKKDFSLTYNISKINELIVEPFYNLLCAGEEKKAKRIGSKTLDAGDIIQTLSGWTAIGYGKSLLPAIKLPFERTRNFKKKSTETHRGIQAMDEAISELSIQCEIKDSGRALYLISAPVEEISVELVKELSDYLCKLAPEAIIRNGDYPTDRAVVDVGVIFSNFKDIERVKEYYNETGNILGEIKRKGKAAAREVSITEEASKDIPSLV